MAMMPQARPQGEPDGDEAAPAEKPQPSGMSPATQPTVNNGMQAAGQALLSPIVRQLERVLPMLGAGTEAGRDVLKALSSLSKHIATGETSPGIGLNAAENTMNQMRQNMPLIAALRQQGAPKPSPQMPSTPAQ